MRAVVGYPWISGVRWVERPFVRRFRVSTGVLDSRFERVGFPVSREAIDDLSSAPCEVVCHWPVELRGGRS
eukprot:3043504-Lingulodinium_polyedra.AAC.1